MYVCVCLTPRFHLAKTHSLLLLLSFPQLRFTAPLLWRPWPLRLFSCCVGSSRRQALHSQRNQGPSTSSQRKVLTPWLFSPCSRLLSRVPLAHVVMCEVWGLTLTRRVLSRQGEHMEEGHGVGCGGQTGSHTKGVHWCPGQGGLGLHSGMRAACKGLLYPWLSHTHTLRPSGDRTPYTLRLGVSILAWRSPV